MSTTLSQEAELHLSAANLRLISERPYLAAALWSMQRVSTHAVPTMAVDDRFRLYYNPTTIREWTAPETAGVLYHEVCHLLRDHCTRLPDTSQTRRWNVAADLEINDDLKDEGVALPVGGLYPQDFGFAKGRLAEEYYKNLPATLPPLRWTGGSCATGDANRPEWEQPGYFGISPYEVRLVRHAVAESIRAERTRGTIPGHWSRWSDEVLAPPKVDWRQEMATCLRRALADAAGATDYRYSRPSRRQSACPDIVLPSLRMPVPSVAIVVDTSGSISGPLLSASLAEVSGILKAAGQREGVTVLSVDAAVHTCQRVFRAEQVRPAGGGGTDMGVGIEAASRLRPRPEIVVVLTDGFTPWPTSSPVGSRVIVGLLDERGTSPTWAKTIDIHF